MNELEWFTKKWKWNLDVGEIVTDREIREAFMENWAFELGRDKSTEDGFKYKCWV